MFIQYVSATKTLQTSPDNVNWETFQLANISSFDGTFVGGLYSQANPTTTYAVIRMLLNGGKIIYWDMNRTIVNITTSQTYSSQPTTQADYTTFLAWLNGLI